MCFTAAGNQLPSLIILKGKESDQGGKILSQKMKTYPKEAFYATQKKAGMSEQMMLFWAEKVVSHMSQLHHGASLLFLNSFKVHLTTSVHNAIIDLGVEIIIIPPGCTGLTQLVDVGYNNPFKNRVPNQNEAWMMEPGQDLTKPPHHLDVASWIIEGEKRMPTKILENAWDCNGLEYFPTVPATPTPPVFPLPACTNEHDGDDDVINLLGV